MYNFYKQILCVLCSCSVTLSRLDRTPIFDSKTLSVLCSVPDRPPEPCPVPVPELKSARYELGTIGDYYTEPPPWVNLTLARIGQSLMKKNLAGFLYSSGLASLAAITSADFTRVMISAGNISRLEIAGKRYLGNFIHFVYWSTLDFTTDQGSFFESLNLLRSVHDKVSHQTKLSFKQFEGPTISWEKDRIPINTELWNAFKQDLESSRLVEFKHREIFPPRDGGSSYYLNQFATMLQYWAFVAMPVMMPEKSLYLPFAEEEIKGFLHFWGFLAHVMGAKPEYNVAMQPDLERAREYFREILEHYVIPGLFDLQYEHKVLLEVSIKGIIHVFPFVDSTIALAQLCQNFLQIPTPNLQRILSPQARIYTEVLNRFGFFTQYRIPSAAVQFVIKGLIQVKAINEFGFDILRRNNFTSGILTYDENVLDTVNLWHYDSNS